MLSENNIISIQLQGGLGNMLFQIATTYAISKRDKKNFVCETNMNIIPHKHYSYYTSNILRNVIFEPTPIPYFTYNEKNFSYNEIPNIQGNLKLSGYFQSEKYFKDFRNEILKLLSPNNKTKDKVDLFWERFINKKTCSIHIRRGDYLQNKNYHYNQDLEYYKRCIEVIGEGVDFLIFSDDLSWCKEHFDFLKNKTYIDGFVDFEELYIMSLCNDNIITNSTFSWWGAWMNQNPTKKVICPKNWFGKLNSHLDTKDIYCENWIII